ncbi:hypothetical protein PC123_g20106 [Phytophthora cactorum]|nr:hypothetical protein PC123_g20106 [Phytophthora cactorum]
MFGQPAVLQRLTCCCGVKKTLTFSKSPFTTITKITKLESCPSSAYRGIVHSCKTPKWKPEPDMVDVYNLLAKLKRQEDAGATLSNRVSKTLDRFCEKDRFAAAHVDIDREEGKHVARCITIQTSHMRYYGRNHNVQHALLTDQQAVTLLLAIIQFKKCNSSWPELRCFMIDKDFT